MQFLSSRRDASHVDGHVAAYNPQAQRRRPSHRHQPALVDRPASAPNEALEGRGCSGDLRRVWGRLGATLPSPELADKSPREHCVRPRIARTSGTGVVVETSDLRTVSWAWRWT